MVDFATPANSSFALTNTVPVASFDSILDSCGGTRSCIPQPGTANKIDHLGYRQRPLHRAAYRNHGGYQSIVTNQSVDASAISGVRWWELRSPNSSPTIYQEGTYAPDSVHRWMGSIAQDRRGEMALGYSVSDATSVFPGVRYTGRLLSDPLGTLPQGEGTFVNGGGSQTGVQRWGDYTAMTVDPTDDCTFWYTNEYYSTTSSSNWQTRIGSFKFPSCSLPRPAADFDGDFRTDRTIFRPSTGAWFSLLSGGSASATGFGVLGDMDVPADYDGDGKIDIAIWRPSSGAWFILQSATSTVRAVGWGTGGDIPLSADVDGDGKADLVVFRPSTGAWFINKSGGGTSAIGFGTSGDQPLLADYDGDRKADLTVFRPSSGAWFIAKSGGGGTTTGFGTSGDVPMTGDWDADGLADLAVFRPSTGQWFVSKSSGGTLLTSWGGAGDIPIVGDVDGDAKSDFTVWRPSTGAWFTQFAAGGSAAVGFGTTGYKPIGRVPGS